MLKYIVLRKLESYQLLTNVTKYVGNWPVNADSLSGIYTGLNTGKTGLIRLWTGLYTEVGMHT